MGKMSKAKTAADTLHADLCTAIADLAKSVDIAVTRMTLRAQCTAAIANAAKVEHAAELLRATATRSSAKKTERAGIVPPVLILKSCVGKKTRAKRGSDPATYRQIKPLRISMPPTNGSQRLSLTKKRKASRPKVRLRCAFWNSMTALVG